MITINDLNKSENLFLVADPCVIEGEDMALRTVGKIVGITEGLHIPYVFRGSYRKADRSHLDSFTGIEGEKTLKILRKVSEALDIPTVTDIHETTEVAMAAGYVNVLQIPVFLRRQADLLVAAARTRKIVNIKKGQFLSPGAVQFVVQKVVGVGNDSVVITERETTFGYTDLAIDFRGIPQMQTFGFPVIMDVTHSLQQPDQTSGVTGRLSAPIKMIAKTAIVIGIDGLFIEAHPGPSQAESGGANILRLDLLEDLLTCLVRLRQAIL